MDWLAGITATVLTYVGKFTKEEISMKTQYAVTLAMLTGIGLGAVAVQGLHAQAKPPVYSVAIIEVSNPDAYAKEFLPLARDALSGGRRVAVGTSTTIQGEPKNPRVSVRVWDSMEKLQAAYNSAGYKDAMKVGEKYAKFNTFAVEGAPQQ
jgi:uncharacterized protein (DUF1330 family)